MSFFWDVVFFVSFSCTFPTSLSRITPDIWQTIVPPINRKAARIISSRDELSEIPPNTEVIIIPLSMEQVEVMELERISPTRLTTDSCICIPMA